MKKAASLSNKIFISLILVLAILSAINIFLPQGSVSPILPEHSLSDSKPVMAFINAAIIFILYGSLGFLGLILSRKLHLPDIWDQNISSRQRFVVPALVGISLGVLFILTDHVVSQTHNLEPFPHPELLTALVASFGASIGEETIFRLFFISFWTWLFSSVILNGRWRIQIFRIVAVLSALAFAMGHIPAVMNLLDLSNISEIPIALLVEIISLNVLLSLVSAHYFRRFGFLAAVGVHFWTDVIWHVIWGSF
ncbi:MAG: CPBP family intramembrane metalloprotease [Candidatus Marinimicrobia bacterium]|nr:CPBP family intramembrane metalloprotease [Candidatus Neomarinimicrobiota bacterium]